MMSSQHFITILKRLLVFIGMEFRYKDFDCLHFNMIVESRNIINNIVCMLSDN